MFWKKLDFSISQTGWSSVWPMQSAKICSAEPRSAKPDGSISQTGGSRISRSLDNLCEMMMVEPDDWRTLLIHYLENSGHIADRKVHQQALKYVVLDNTLYR
jgi:hypothetical protein